MRDNAPELRRPLPQLRGLDQIREAGYVAWSPTTIGGLRQQASYSSGLAGGRWLASPLKRFLDVGLAGLLLILSSPILILAVVLIRLSSPGPALFRQPRVGKNCRKFLMLKLRTMVDGADQLEGDLAKQLEDQTFFKLKNDPRVTPLGRFLRKYSVDELPQLYNVLRGDMSLVGPRPLLTVDMRKFPQGQQMRRFSVLPGVTGLWQVSGRSRSTDRERMELDLDYVDKWSLTLDLRILARTIPAVFSGDGAY